jgi:hypothetical protein
MRPHVTSRRYRAVVPYRPRPRPELPELPVPMLVMPLDELAAHRRILRGVLNAQRAVIVIDGDGRQLGVLTADRRVARAARYGRLATEALLAELDKAAPSLLANGLRRSRPPHGGSPDSP